MILIYTNTFIEVVAKVGDLSIVVCVIGWVITIKVIELCWEIFLSIVIVVIVFFAMQILWFEHLKKNKKKII